MKILLGVTGGIAAYKAAELVRAFKKRGDDVRVVMSRGAQEFIAPLTFQVLSENPVGTEIFDPTYESEIGHIELARWADVVLVAPATANFIGRLAAGMSDDLLTTVLLATAAPVVIAPAMNTQMMLHPFVQRNLRLLAEHPGYSIVDPDSGELACKEVGTGRLPDPPVLLDAVDTATSPGILKGRKVLITAGPTREHIDPARFISNPSTGKMGYALARIAHKLGAEVTLVSGPTSLEAPHGVDFIPVITARQMHAEVMPRAASMDFLVMVAAVADWRPATSSDAKLEKAAIPSNLALERNPDILAELGERYGVDAVLESPRPLVIGFAAETQDVEARGRAKMQRKKAHMMIANQIGGPDSAFGADISSINVLNGTTSVAFRGETKESLAMGIWTEAARARDGIQ
ncbi:MAG: bifunctional phosphopantothenoylcysteine decarboxylase/phosphopantothenate--cysteine ligase CoaBC [Bradymonadaceae bacterium]